MCSPMPDKPDMPDVNADELVDIGANTADDYSSSYQHEIDPSWSINPSWSTKTIKPQWSIKPQYEGVLGKAIKPSVLENQRKSSDG